MKRNRMGQAITDVPGIRVGHWTDLRAATGCTVVLCEDGAVAGVDVRGSAPGTRETDLMRPINLVRHAHAIILSGGSAFGLDCAGGVMRYLEERGKGFRARRWRVPIVGAAVLMDLSLGDGRVRPGLDEGYAACMNAVDGDLDEGSVGAGTGATVGKALGPRRCVKGGIGTSSTQIDGGIVVGAIVAVNAYGEVRDPDSGRTVAGPRGTDGGFVSTVQSLARGAGRQPMKGENTTIGVVATNARLDKEQANKLAQMAQDGVAATVRPAHGMGDGDVIFALATGAVTSRKRANVTALGAVAADIVASAIFRGVSQATRLAGVPAARDVIPAK